MASTSYTNSGYDDSKRPFSMSSLRGAPSSPHTPQHNLRSNNSSFASTTSSTSFRGEEDAIIFELGARWLRAGFEGESVPMCVVGCGPEECRRVGDYRGWLKTNNPDTDPAQLRPLVNPEDWASAHELWKMDLRGVDLGLVEDKIERVFRETYNKYLLTDAGTSRLVLVLPAIMPHPLLSALLSTLFSRWRFPSITLLTSATMAATAAGVRSALVVDIGWAETVVTGVYEYREIAIKRSTRAMKALLQETGRLLTSIPTARGVRSQPAPGDSGISVRFEFCEEVASRFLWCRPREGPSPADLQQQQPQPDDSETEPTTHHSPLSSLLQRTVEIPSPSNPGSTYINLPFSTFSEPVESVLFAAGTADCELDDEEKPLPLLIYNALLTLPPDARGTCMSRIIFTGGGANIPGIRQRILADVAALVAEHGWSPVRGKVIEQQRRKLANLRISPSSQVQASAQDPASPHLKTTDPSEDNRPAPSNDIPTETKSPEASTHSEPNPESATEKPTQQQQQQQQPPEDPKPEDEADLEDPIEQKIRRNNRDRDRDALPPSVQGVLREVESLGPWAGASLTTSLKIRGLVEIEREKYLQHGLAGATTREFEAHGHHVPDRRSGLRAGGGGDRSSWTLAGWG